MPKEFNFYLAKAEVWVIRWFSLLVLVLVGLSCFFLDRSADIDEIGLYNPVYTYLHSGKMTYPVHGQFDYMTVHPPLHYLIIAWFMKLGMSFYYAQLALVFGLTCLILLLIERGAFSNPVKFGLVAGLFGGAALMFGSSLYVIRPDLSLSLAWFSGLIALESARLQQWDIKRLILGSFLLTFASGLHYFGAPAFIGVLVYVVWAYRTLDFHLARQKILALGLGISLFAIPYLALFVIPDWEGIRSMISSVQQEGGVWQALLRHFDAYEYWLKGGYSPYQSISKFFTLPIFWLKIPAILISTITLAVLPCTRGIALASLPLPLFVLLYSQGKSAGYYIPEFILYLSGLVILIIFAVKKLTQIISFKFSSIVTLSLLLALSFCFTQSWMNLFKNVVALKPHIHEMEIARATAKEIVGVNALVSSRLGLWYAAGATHWYDPSSDLLSPNALTESQLTSYFSKIDAIAEHNHMSNVTYNQSRTSIASLFLTKKLKLKGFYFAQSSTNLSYLLLANEQSNSVEGYGLRNDQLFHFKQTPTGNYIFASVLCPFNTLNEIPVMGTLFTDALYPADQKGNSFPTETAISSFIIEQEKYVKAQTSTLSKCQNIAFITGKLEPVDKQMMLDKLKQQDEVIHFYRTLESAISGKQLDSQGLK